MRIIRTKESDFRRAQQQKISENLIRIWQHVSNNSSGALADDKGNLLDRIEQSTNHLVTQIGASKESATSRESAKNQRSMGGM